jgi:hypothetical protein
MLQEHGTANLPPYIELTVVCSPVAESVKLVGERRFFRGSHGSTGCAPTSSTGARSIGGVDPGGDTVGSLDPRYQRGPAYAPGTWYS